MVKIDRCKAREAFDNYVKAYDISNEKIKLKIEHTYRVSELCERLAKNLGFSQNDIDISWLMGLLHDIGRFEQVKRYGTFNDSKSVDHAKLGVEILFSNGMIRKFIDDDSEDKLIKAAIDVHNAYKIPEDFSERTKSFCNILRDADKIDIFKVNIICPPEDVYGVSNEELHNSEITEEVLDNFKEKYTIIRKLKRTAVDNVVGHISLLFGLVYEESIRITLEQGYFEQLINFKSNNKKTAQKFVEIHKFVDEYIDEKMNG